MAYLPFDLNASTTLSNNQVQANDAALDTAISGNLTEQNFSSATRMPNSMLASPNVEEILTFHWGAPAGTAVPSPSTTVPMAYLDIPGTGTYTVLGASYALLCPTGGGTTGSVRIDAGTIAASVFSVSTNLVASTALGNVASNNQSARGNFTLAATTFTAPITLAVNSTLASTTATPRITFTLRVTRSLQ